MAVKITAAVFIAVMLIGFEPRDKRWAVAGVTSLFALLVAIVI